MKAGKATKVSAQLPQSFPRDSITISFPESWVSRPVHQADVLLKYASPSFEHFVVIRVTPFSSAPELNVQEWTQSMAQLGDGAEPQQRLYGDFLREEATLWRAKKCTVQGIPSLDIVWDIEAGTEGQRTYIIKRILNVPLNGYFLCIETAIGGLSSPEIRGLARSAFGEADALYDQIFASLSILRAQAPSKPASPVIPQVTDFVADYSTKGHPKAKGVEMRLGYPKGWKQEEGDRPNVVQKFISPKGYADGCLGITIGNLPDEASDLEIKEMFAGEGPSDILPEGARQISRQHTKIEQLDADIVTYILKAERAGLTVTLHSQNLVFAINRKLVVVNMSFGPTGDLVDENDILKRAAHFDLLFKLCINRIVLPAKWSL